MNKTPHQEFLSEALVADQARIGGQQYDVVIVSGESDEIRFIREDEGLEFEMIVDPSSVHRIATGIWAFLDLNSGLEEEVCQLQVLHPLTSEDIEK